MLHPYLHTEKQNTFYRRLNLLTSCKTITNHVRFVIRAKYNAGDISQPEWQSSTHMKIYRLINNKIKIKIVETNFNYLT